MGLMPSPGPLEAPLWSSESNERVSPTYSSSSSGLQGPLQTYSQKEGGEETGRTCPWRTIDGGTGKDRSLHVGRQGRKGTPSLQSGHAVAVTTLERRQLCRHSSVQRGSLGMWTAGQSRAWRGLLVGSWGASGPGS